VGIYICRKKPSLENTVPKGGWHQWGIWCDEENYAREKAKERDTIRE